MEDTFRTIQATTKSIYTEKRSKFIAYAIPVRSVEEVKTEVEKYRKEYYDSRHVCWAYMLGAERKDFRSNDDGEPSGTAGKPILGQINSNELTDILVVVVRYFGGIKLGTSGLIVAYREAAAQAIAEAEIIEKTVDCSLSFTFDYILMNDVMKVIKDLKPTIVSQDFDTTCSMTLEIRKSTFETLKSKIGNIEGVKVANKEE